MKLELKENMYIRTKDGHIDKILLVDYAEEKRQHYPNHPSKKYWRDKILLLKAGYWRTTQNIIKASYNIIDILEVGDILVDDANRKLEILLIDNELMVRNTGLIYDNNYYLPIKSIAIKSVITHEQMEQMAYKVGE